MGQISQPIKEIVTTTRPVTGKVGILYIDRTTTPDTLYIWNGSAYEQVGGSTLDGSGATNKLAYWSDSDTLNDSEHLTVDETNDRLGIQVSAPLTPAHYASTTSSTIAPVTTGSTSLVDEVPATAPTVTITKIAEPAAGSGGYGSYTNGGSGTAIYAYGSSYELRVYPCLYVASTGTYYRSQFYETISLGTDPTDYQSYDISFNAGSVSISGETVYYFVEYDINGGGSWSPVGVFSSSSDTITSLSGSDTTTAWGDTYKTTAGSGPDAPVSFDSMSENYGYSGFYENNTYYQYEVDTYKNISGTNYVSGYPVSIANYDANMGSYFAWDLNWTLTGSYDGVVLRRSTDGGSSWTYQNVGATSNYTDDNFSDDGSGSMWGNTYSGGGDTTFSFYPYGQDASPSDNPFYSSQGSLYSATITGGDTARYIFKHNISGGETNNKLLDSTLTYGKTVNGGSYYDAGYTTWADGTTVTPTTYGFTGTNQNRAYYLHNSSLGMFSLVSYNLSTSSSGGTKSVSATGITYPTGSTQIRVYRRINGTGNYAYKTLTSSTSTFVDDALDVSWTNAGSSYPPSPTGITPGVQRLDKNNTSRTDEPHQALVSTGSSTRYTRFAMGIANDSASTPTYYLNIITGSSTGYTEMVSNRFDFMSSIGGTAGVIISPGGAFIGNNANSSTQHFTVKGQNDSSLINTRSDQDTVGFGQALGSDESATVVIQPARSTDAGLVLKGHSSMSSTSPLLRTQTSAGSYGAYITVGGHIQAGSDNNTNPGHSWRSDPNTGFTNPTSDTIGVTTNGSEMARFDSSGRFGVRNTSLTAYIDAPASTTSIASMRIRAGTAPTSPNEGDVWNNSTVKGIGVFVDGISGFVSRTLFTQTANATVSNTTTETTLVGTGTGTMTLPANFFTAGKQIRVRAWGFHSTAATPNLNIRIKLGSTVICATGNHAMHNDTNGLWRVEGEIVCRTTGASGTVFGQGLFNDYGTGGDTVQMVNTATTTINTTTSQVVSITAQFDAASASNTITCTHLSLETLN